MSNIEQKNVQYRRTRRGPLRAVRFWTFKKKDCVKKTFQKLYT